MKRENILKFPNQPWAGATALRSGLIKDSGKSYRKLRFERSLKFSGLCFSSFDWDPSATSCLWWIYANASNHDSLVKIGFDTAESEPSNVSWKWGVQKGSVKVYERPERLFLFHFLANSLRATEGTNWIRRTPGKGRVTTVNERNARSSTALARPSSSRGISVFDVFCVYCHLI